jgi:hypothetical protein
MTKRFWLSFCDANKPKGRQFLGACIVEVTDADAADAKADIDVRFPQHMEGAEWLAAASRKAWLLGCNPGGEVLSADVTDTVMPEGTPIGVLMDKAALIAGGHVTM